MKCYASIVCFLSVFVFVSSAPFLPGGGLSGGLQLNGGTGGSSQSGGGGGGGGLTDILSQIDLPGLLRGVNSVVKLVGVFCPPCSQILDNVIQNVTSTAFRVFGRAILQGGGGLGGGGGNSGGGGNAVSVVLPTFPPDEDDYEDEETSEKSSASLETANRFADVETEIKNDTDSTTAKNELPDAPYTSSNSDDNSNAIVRRHARVTRDVEAEDQAAAESAPQPSEEIDDIEDDQDRNKRFLPFGGGEHSGGSGNFLFDIIRNTADRAARMVGTVYRMVAGTQHFGWGSPNSEKPQTSDYLAAQSSPAVQLVAGSGATEESDEKANAPEGVEGEPASKSAEHYSEGIPGPITRLLVIANRGVANLVQDLILKTSDSIRTSVNNTKTKFTNKLENLTKLLRSSSKKTK